MSVRAGVEFQELARQAPLVGFTGCQEDFVTVLHVSHFKCPRKPHFIIAINCYMRKLTQSPC